MCAVQCFTAVLKRCFATFLQLAKLFSVRGQPYDQKVSENYISNHEEFQDALLAEGISVSLRIMSNNIIKLHRNHLNFRTHCKTPLLSELHREA